MVIAWILVLLLMIVVWRLAGRPQGPDGSWARLAFLLLLMVVGVLASFLLPGRVSLYPQPHQVSKYPDGVSLRFAMVHDVIHDRYPRHGAAYYRERNRQ